MGFVVRSDTQNPSWKHRWTNLEVGMKSWTLRCALSLAVAAYNAGEKAVVQYGGIPPYPETQAYVKYVRARYEQALR